MYIIVIALFSCISLPLPGIIEKATTQSRGIVHIPEPLVFFW